MTSVHEKLYYFLNPIENQMEYEKSGNNVQAPTFHATFVRWRAHTPEIFF